MSIQPRKERKKLYTLPTHKARAQVSAHLTEDLLLKYNTRSTTLRKGDEVRVLRGDFKGTKGKVLEINAKERRVTVENVTITKADHTQKPRWVSPSNVVITKLDLTDPKRRDMLGASAADAEAAAEPEAPAEEEKKEEK
jgi:large subunit ribosomal protein L24